MCTKIVYYIINKGGRMKAKHVILILPLVIIGVFIYSFIQATTIEDEPLLKELSHYEYVTFSAG